MSDAQSGLMTIFAEALRRTDPSARSAYLDSACGEDLELRAKVEALLESQGGGDRFLEPDRLDTSEMATGAHEPEASRDTVDQDTRPARRPGLRSSAGEVIAGRYTLGDVLGEGGMGTVYRAEQTQPVRRQVALKLIKTGIDSRVVLARFDAERQALALMDHPNIARVFDGGTTEANQPFFVMELVQGLPITSYCDQKRLPVEARLHLFVTVCQAVQHAHQKGIIHRDLKPGNVLVTEVDGRPSPKVIDFGVAKASEFELTDQSLSDTGAIVGTPAYMSPEQADPSSMDIDTRTDVYALGVILYELLAGSPPIDPRDFKRGAVLEMLRMVREVEPSKPSTKVSTSDTLPNIAASRSIDPETLKRSLRGDLDWVVMKALEKDRDRRYETANSFASDILRHIANEPVEAAPPSRSYRLKKFVQKHRGAVVAASLVLLALIVGTVGTTWGLIRAAKANTQLAERNRELADEREKVQARFDLAQKAIATFHTGVSEDTLLKNEQFKELRIRLLKQAAGFYGDLETLLQGETDDRSRKTLALGYIQLARLTEKIASSSDALAVHRKALAVRRELADSAGAEIEDRFNVARSLGDVGRLLFMTGDSPGAVMALEEQRTLAEDLAARSTTVEARTTLARSQIALGVVLKETGRTAEALEAYRKAIAIQQDLASLHPDDDSLQTDLSRVYNNIAVVLSETGKPGEAIDEFRRALALEKKRAALKPDDTNLASTVAQYHINIGGTLWTMEKAEEALEEYGNALAILEPLAASNNAVTTFKTQLASTRNNMGAILSETGKPEEALAEFREALAIQQALVEANPTVSKLQSDLAMSHRNIGTILRVDQPEEALKSFRKGLAIQQALADADPAVTWFQSEVAVAHHNIAGVHDVSGNLNEAQNEYDKARAIVQKLIDDNPTFSYFQRVGAKIDLDLGKMLAGDGQWDKADSLYERSQTLAENIAETDPTIASFQSELAGNLASLGLAQQGGGQFASASKTFHRAIEIMDAIPAPSAIGLYNLGCMHARLAALAAEPNAGISALEGKAAADQAMDHLRNAVAAGYNDIANMKIDSDLDALRTRDDFKTLMAEMEPSSNPPESKP